MLRGTKEKVASVGTCSIRYWGGGGGGGGAGGRGGRKVLRTWQPTSQGHPKGGGGGSGPSAPASLTCKACAPWHQDPLRLLSGPLQRSKPHRPWGDVCPARARRATFLLTIPTSAPDLPSHGEATQVDHIALHTFPTKHVAK